MTYRLRIREEAFNDGMLGFFYYEEILTGLGSKFLDRLYSRYKEIVVQPLAYSFLGKGKVLRFARLRPFPYIIIFEVEEDEIIIYQVFNTYLAKSKRHK